MNAVRVLRLHHQTLLTLLADLFFLWIIFQYALGGWETAQILFAQIGLPVWTALGIVCALALYGSDYLTDFPLFIAAYALGYWGEWWGTTHSVWTYWNQATPPDYLPPLWAIGLLTITHLRRLFAQAGVGWPSVRLPADLSRNVKVASFIVLPVLAFWHSAPRLAVVDWSGRLDVNFFAGVGVGIALLLYHIDIDEMFGLYVCGMLLGGIYEWLGTWIHEWTYITQEVPPLWIIPLWGLAGVAMVNLSRLMVNAIKELTLHARGERAKSL